MEKWSRSDYVQICIQLSYLKCLVQWSRNEKYKKYKYAKCKLLHFPSQCSALGSPYYFRVLNAIILFTSVLNRYITQ